MRRGEAVGTIGPDPDGAGALKHRASAQRPTTNGLLTKSRDTARSTASPTPTGRRSPRLEAVDIDL